MLHFTAFGKQVKDGNGEHFADCASEVAALLIVAALNWRNHRPVIADGEVICSRCQSALPQDGSEPCVPRTPRCDQTPDLFGEAAGGPAEPEVQQVRPARRSGPQRPAAVLRASDRKRQSA